MNRKLVVTDIGVLEEQIGKINECPAEGVIVKVCYTGVCQTDSHIYTYGRPVQKEYFPLVIGHEISGIIYKFGILHSKDLKALKVGDKVVAYCNDGCLTCNACRAGYNLLCAQKTAATSEYFGFYSDGGFQEYLTVQNPSRLVKLGGDVDLALACLLPCSGLTGYNAIDMCRESIDRAIQIKGYANVVHNGAGALSSFATEIAKAQHGDKINLLVTDLENEKLRDAKAAGADMTLKLSKDEPVRGIAKNIKSQFKGVGVDAAIDFVQTQQSQTYLFAVLAEGGCQAFVGTYEDTLAPLNSMTLITRQIELYGCFVGTKQQLRHVVDLVESAKLYGPPITFIRLNEVESTLKKMIDGTPYRGRFIVDMNKMKSKY